MERVSCIIMIVPISQIQLRVVVCSKEHGPAARLDYKGQLYQLNYIRAEPPFTNPSDSLNIYSPIPARSFVCKRHNFVNALVSCLSLARVYSSRPDHGVHSLLQKSKSPVVCECGSSENQYQMAIFPKCAHCRAASSVQKLDTIRRC
jgi:hypothetical protein